MANKVSDEMEKQVLELQHQGKTIRKIANALKVSRNTVRRISRESGKEKEVKKVPLWARSIDWEKVKKEEGRGATLKILRTEFAPETSYHTFWQFYNKGWPLLF